MSRHFFGKITGVTTALSVFLPSITFAALIAPGAPATLMATAREFLTVFNQVIVPIFIAIIVIYIVIAAFQFAVSGGDEEKRNASRGKIVWGLVGLVLIFMIYGIIAVLLSAVLPTAGTNLPVPPGVSI
ncbi:MAG TPA: hypothetical protein VJC04_03085 [Candidatus Paceibacterota bacterium]